MSDANGRMLVDDPAALRCRIEETLQRFYGPAEAIPAVAEVPGMNLREHYAGLALQGILSRAPMALLPGSVPDEDEPTPAEASFRAVSERRQARLRTAVIGVATQLAVQAADRLLAALATEPTE